MLTSKQNIINRKVILVQRETSIRKVAEAIGHSPAAVMFAINKCGQSRRMHEKIAGALGVTLAEFWPELYGPDGIKCENSVSHDSTINESFTNVN